MLADGREGGGCLQTVAGLVGEFYRVVMAILSFMILFVKDRNCSVSYLSFSFSFQVFF